MTDLEALNTAIQEAAISGIASVTVAGQTVVTKSLKELREWREELINSQAAARPGFGLRFQKITPRYQ